MGPVTAIVLLAFAGGACALQASAALPAHPAAIAIAGLTLLGASAWCPRRASRPACIPGWVVACSAGLAACVLGFGYAAWRAEARVAEELPPEWEGEDVALVGIVDDLPAVSVRGTRFAFTVERVVAPRAVVPQRLSLAWMAPWPDGDAAPVPALRAGERWQLTVRLKRPHGNVNPGGFDLEAWLLQHALRATGTVAASGQHRRVDAFAGRPRDVVQRARERIRDRILRALQDARYAGVVVALAIGDQRAIPEAQWTVFNRTGVTHLVSISGLHVTVFAALAGALAHALARRSVRLTSRVPARKVAVAVGVLAAGGYVLLAGAEIPAVRTFAMLAVAATGLWLGRPGTAAIVWLWALAAVLVWDPWAPLTPGFWLSYGAVALLLYAGAGRLREARAAGVRARAWAHLRAGAHAQWVVTVGLAPLTLALFQQASLIAPVANAVAIPVVTLGVVPAALAGILLPFDGLFVAAHAVLAPLMRALELLAALPDATWQQHAPPAWTVAVAFAGIAWLLAPRAVPGRAWGALWLVPLFVVAPPTVPAGAFRLTVLDVGQGLAVVVATRRHTLVYDAGPRYTDTTDAGGRIVAPYLRATGARRADGFVVSHQDLDHAGGALSLLQAVPVGWFASSLDRDHPVVAAAQERSPVLPCVAGQQWTWDDVRFTVLHPTGIEYDDALAKSNDRSCVVRIDSAHGSALVAGDIEARSERALLERRAGALRADVLVVPHHGSRTSSTHAFIRAVAPAIAVVGCGYRNRFGHPRPDIVARYASAGALVVRTDLAGALTFTFAPGRALAPESARAQRARYWLDVPRAAAAPLE
ncbi:MAG: DNA internalization-related competence protein ComEC/Rec2 [Burkholderiales bacterium]